MLPEQRFLVKGLPGPWRHIGARFYWEAGPDIEIARQYVRLNTGGEWANVNIDQAVIGPLWWHSI